MIIASLLPKDRIRGLLGDRANPGKQPTARMRLLFCGAIVLFFGLVILRVIRL